MHGQHLTWVALVHTSVVNKVEHDASLFPVFKRIWNAAELHSAQTRFDSGSTWCWSLKFVSTKGNIVHSTSDS